MLKASGLEPGGVGEYRDISPEAVLIDLGARVCAFQINPGHKRGGTQRARLSHDDPSVGGACQVAAGARHRLGGDGEHARVLDPGLRTARVAWHRGRAGERQAAASRAGPQDGHARLPMAAAVPGPDERAGSPSGQRPDQPDRHGHRPRDRGQGAGPAAAGGATQRAVPENPRWTSPNNLTGTWREEQSVQP